MWHSSQTQPTGSRPINVGSEPYGPQAHFLPHQWQTLLHGNKWYVAASIAVIASTFYPAELEWPASGLERLLDRLPEATDRIFRTRPRTGSNRQETGTLVLQLAATSLEPKWKAN